MSDIASSDLFNIVQVLQSWSFKRNSNRIYSGRKDWPEDSPATHFAFLLVILMEIAVLYAWCFFLRTANVSLQTTGTATVLREGLEWPGSDSYLTGIAGLLAVAAVGGWRCEFEHNLLKGDDVTVCAGTPN